MPMTTFLMESEGLAVETLPRLDELLQEVRQVTGEDWRVLELRYTARRGFAFWRRRAVTHCYQVLFGLGSGEYQVINFWRPWSEQYSLNDLAPADIAAAYLQGVLTGARES